jgi:hypothetical protein
MILSGAFPPTFPAVLKEFERAFFFFAPQSKRLHSEVQIPQSAQTLRASHFRLGESVVQYHCVKVFACARTKMILHHGLGLRLRNCVGDWALDIFHLRRIPKVLRFLTARDLVIRSTRRQRERVFPRKMFVTIDVI